MFDQMAHGTAPSSASAPPQKVLRFDKAYLKSLPGIVKIIALVCNIAGFICIKISWAFLSAIFYNILYWCGNILTGFLLLMYTFHFVEKYDRLPWLKCEFVYCGVMSLAFVCTSIFATTIGENTGYAVGFFGLCSIIAYGVDCFLKYKAWKRGLPPQ